MTTRRFRAAAMRSAWIAIALAIAVGGCGKSSKKTTQPPPSGPPNPNSPVNAVLLLQYAVQHRDTTLYKSLFPTSYAFSFAPGDTAATNAFPGTWGYLEEREFATHLFDTGSSGGAGASSITMPFSGRLADEPVPGRNATYHRRVSALFVLTIQKLDTSSEQIVGGSTFFLVRGDSVTLPADLVAGGVQANSGRWFVEGWKDETGGVTPSLLRRPGVDPARSLPTSLPTLGELKVRYLPVPPALRSR